MAHTDHFPKSYILVCPELHQVQHLNEYRGKNPEFFKDKNETWFWNAFVKSNLDIQRVQTFHPWTRSDGKLSLLERLPSELIEEILDQIPDHGDSRVDNMENILAFGLSSARIWPIVLHRIHRDYQRALSINWAGRKVGYHGTFSRFTQAQVENYGIETAMFHKLPIDYWCWEPSQSQLETEWTEKIAEIRGFCPELTESEWDQVEQDVSQAYKYPQDRVWVLRNLTTKQFVRSDKLLPPTSANPDSTVVKPIVSNRTKIAKFWDNIKGKGKKREGRDETNEPLTLAQVFLVLTCYTNRIGIPFLERIFAFQQGPWTGHAFEVVTIEDHLADSEMHVEDAIITSKFNNDDEKKVAWTDVSELAAADVGSLRWCLRKCEDMFGDARSPKSMTRDEAFWRVISDLRRSNRSWTGVKNYEDFE